MSNFWDSVWLIFSAFLFVAYLFVMFQVITDLFRDDTVGGFGKAAWIVGLIFVPMLTALVYIISRGNGMARAAARRGAAREGRHRRLHPAGRGQVASGADRRRQGAARRRHHRARGVPAPEGQGPRLSRGRVGRTTAARVRRARRATQASHGGPGGPGPHCEAHEKTAPEGAVFVAGLPRDQRCASGLTSRGVAPTKSWRGRPILYSGSAIISFSCAIQPTVRASAKTAVNSGTGMPIAFWTMPE